MLIEGQVAATIRDCRFESSSVSGDGGAVFTNSSLASRFEDCVFVNNLAVNGGGAIFNADQLRLVRCVFLDNTAGAALPAPSGP